MGANLCIPLRPKPNGNNDHKPKEGSSFKNLFKKKCFKRKDQNGKNTHELKRKTGLEAADKKACKVSKMTLKDWTEDTPDLNPDYIRRSEFLKHSKKRVHPSSSQARGSALFGAKDSLILARPMMYQYHHEEAEAKMESLSLGRSSSGKSMKRVSFKLPHTVKYYLPDEPKTESIEAPFVTLNEPDFSEAASSDAPEEPYFSCDESSFSPVAHVCREDSFELSPWFIPAVHTLPPASVCSSPSI